MRKSKPVKDVFSWEDVQDKFLAEYQSETLRERRVFEFEALTCVSCGSVDVYAQRFIGLCRYTPTLVATDRQKVR